MSAFIPPNEPHSAPISTPDSREESSESLSISAPGHQSTFDRHRQGSTGGNNAPKISQRAQHALRQGRNASSPGLSGGLSAQYSTSMPNSGGYFAVTSGGDGGVDERRQKEKEREQKRRAMQAAWGVDTRESAVKRRRFGFLFGDVSLTNERPLGMRSRAIRGVWGYGD
jgi:hypothetical protein